jgi:hypothetical protein
MDMSAPGVRGADVLMMSRRTGPRQGFLSGATRFVLAVIDVGTAAFTALVKVCATLVHFGQFLAHEAHDFHAEQWVDAQELLKRRRFDEAEHAIALATGAEGVWLGAQHGRQANDAPRAKEPLENLFVLKFNDHRKAYEPGADDVDAAARRSLLDNRLPRDGVGRGCERFQGLQELWR